MKSLIYIAMSVMAMALALIGCSSGAESAVGQEEEVAETLLPQAVDDSAPADSDIFAIGAEDAARLLAECQKIDQVELQLLDIKARIHLIDTRVSRQAAEDYTKGFTDYIKTHNDTLARILF